MVSRGTPVDPAQESDDGDSSLQPGPDDPECDADDADGSASEEMGEEPVDWSGPEAGSAAGLVPASCTYWELNEAQLGALPYKSFYKLMVKSKLSPREMEEQKKRRRRVKNRSSSRNYSSRKKGKMSSAQIECEALRTRVAELETLNRAVAEEQSQQLKRMVELQSALLQARAREPGNTLALGYGTGTAPASLAPASFAPASRTVNTTTVVTGGDQLFTSAADRAGDDPVLERILYHSDGAPLPYGKQSMCSSCRQWVAGTFDTPPPIDIEPPQEAEDAEMLLFDDIGIGEPAVSEAAVCGDKDQLPPFFELGELFPAEVGPVAELPGSAYPSLGHAQKRESEPRQSCMQNTGRSSRSSAAWLS